MPGEQAVGYVSPGHIHGLTAGIILFLQGLDTMDLEKPEGGLVKHDENQYTDGI